MMRLMQNYVTFLIVLFCFVCFFIVIDQFSKKEPTVVYHTKFGKCCHFDDNLKTDQKIDSLYWSLKKVKPACDLPLYIDPNDPFIKPYLNDISQINCNRDTVYTFVDYEKGLLKLTASGKTRRLRCNYTWIYRGKEDQDINYSQSRQLPKEGVKFSNENYVANVSCYDRNDNFANFKYENTHLWIPDFEKTDGNSNKPSVLIVVIESLSRNCFLRFMSRTEAAMKKLNYFTVLEGLTKVGVNSFPNSMALIANKAVNNASYSPDYWDNKLDYVWNHYKNSGYVTAFVEDFVKVGLFDYCNKGFSKKPTDFHPRPFWLQQFITNYTLYDAMKDEKQYCFHNYGTRIEQFFEHLIEFAKKMLRRDQPYFMYSFYSQVTHENFNNFKLVDEFVADFLDEIAPYLSNTLLIVMGDHGPRYGLMSDTPLGKLESNLPFFGIRIPEKLHEKHPYLRKVLEYNKKRLISWFDIHKLLRDIADGQFSFIENEGKHLLNPSRQLVSPLRSCKDAEIPSLFCTCGGHIEVDQDDVGFHLKPAGEEFRKTVVKWIENYCNGTEIGNGSVYHINLPSKNESLSFVERVGVGVLIPPSNSTLQAMMKRTANNLQSPWSDWEIDTNLTDINRLKQLAWHSFCPPQ